MWPALLQRGQGLWVTGKKPRGGRPGSEARGTSGGCKVADLFNEESPNPLSITPCARLWGSGEG